MIVLDTNVISELFRPAPDRRVLYWVEAQEADELFTTSVTEAEMFSGIGFMAAGRRRSDLFSATEAYFRSDLAGRILSFDSAAARSYAEITAIRKRKGLSISAFDMQIAAIARTCNAVLATRNTKDFEFTGVQIVNPWLG
ncbi:MAG: type II toxin-antitoxin system VapC family toxin [Silvibacterium sp.]